MSNSANLKPYCFGLSAGAGKRLFVSGEPVVKVVQLGGTANPFETHVLLTLEGNVHLRSGDGRKSSRAQPDLQFDPDSISGPVFVDAR